MKKIGIFAAISLSMSLAHAQSVRFERDVLFVKLQQGAELPSHPMIKESKHLFGQYYQLKTDDAVLLENDLRDEPSVVTTEKSYYAGTRELALPGKAISVTKASVKGFNDPQAAQVWAFRDAAQHGVSVERAYTQLPNRTSSPVIVAVVDTGVDYRHEDLRNVMWKNTKEIAGNNIDDDNNGYVDDIYGINTLVRTAQDTPSGDPAPSHAHGTHVSGTIAAEQNNGVGIAGIAANVKIMAIRTVPDSSDETDKDVVESFLYAAKHGAKLINCSFGKSVNEGGMIVSETIKHVGETYGTLVVAAAGNDSWGPFNWFNIDTNLKYPASFENEHLLVIAATKENGRLASFSNIGLKNVDLAAPGQDVFSTVPGNRYSSMSGTSMATPTTVGVAAQVLSYFPRLSPLELKDVLMKSVSPVAEYSGKMVTGGRVDLAAALKYAEANYPQRAGR